MFWSQTSQFESTSWLRLPSKSCDWLKKTPFVWTRFCADWRSIPTKFGIVKFTAGACGAGARVGATADGVEATEGTEGTEDALDGGASTCWLDVDTPADADVV